MQNEKINNVFNNKDNKTKELLLKKYLQKCQEKNDIITNKENESGTILPNTFRLHKAKTFAINNFVNKIMTIIRKRILQKALNNRNEKAKKNRNRIKDPFVHKTRVSVIQMFIDIIKKKSKSSTK